MAEDNNRPERAINASPLSWQQALRDTEYSHPKIFEDEDPYVYHCGIDIFNNHRLRSNTFTHIGQISSADTENTTFNTIFDYVRDKSGNTVSEVVSLVNSAETDVHIYGVDTIRTMEDCYFQELKEENGWYGFINKTDIDIPNAVIENKDGEKEEISINKVLNNNRACEFIDLYPDRSLFSFIPKVNKYRNRVEKNWDYCITYPYLSDYEKFNEIVDLSNDIPISKGGSSLKIISQELIKSPTGNQLIRFKTMFRHTLEVGNFVRLYYTIDDGATLKEINKLAKVISIGNFEGKETNRYFTINFRDIASDFSIIETDDIKELVTNDGGDTFTFYYKKTINNIDYQYYVRVFKKITNNGEELSSDVNKLAYGENIYGDRVAQVIFTDTIDVEGLVDNNKRPLSELFFTVIKRNQGNSKWYEEGDYGNEEVEFSHCFGDVFSGIDMPEDVDDYNVRKIHNIDVENLDEVTIEVLELQESVAKISSYDYPDSAITIKDEAFFGDIVEFNPLEYTETVLEVIQHRFNTMQRETPNIFFKNILNDALMYDDYDEGITSGFTVVSGYSNTYNGEEFYGNLNPEGYFYNPFTRIQIREERETVNTVIGSNIKFNSISVPTMISDDIYAFDVETMVDYRLIKGDTLGFYNTDTREVEWCSIWEVSGTNVTFITDNGDLTFNADTTLIVKTNEGVPVYAKYIPSIHSFIWRGLKKQSELSIDSNLYDMPFANGCFYIHKNSNLFVRRQDPEGEYGLLPTNPKNPLTIYNIPGWNKVDIEDDNIYYNNDDLGRICY